MKLKWHPFCKSSNASFENVENVVKPPHRPTVRNSARLCDIFPFLLINPPRIPINRQPSRLTTRVP